MSEHIYRTEERQRGGVAVIRDGEQAGYAYSTEEAERQIAEMQAEDEQEPSLADYEPAARFQR